MPGKLVLQSPGLQVPPSDEQRRKMEKLKERDVMILPKFFDNIAPVLATGEDAYLLSPILDDMTGYPPTDIFYGTEEVMIAYIDDMKATCEKYGVRLNVHIGEGVTKFGFNLKMQIFRFAAIYPVACVLIAWICKLIW